MMESIRRKIRMPGKMPETVPVVFYVALFLVFFGAFLFSGFPKDSLERRLVSELQKKSPVPVFVGDAQLKSLSSVELKNIRISPENMKPVRIDRARVSTGIFSVLFSDEVGISVSADLYEGKAEGNFQVDKNGGRLIAGEIKIDSVDMSFISGFFPEGDAGFSLDGKAGGTVELFGEKGKQRLSSLRYRITSDSATINLSRIKGIIAGSSLENLAAEISGTSNRFETRLEKLSLENKDISLSAYGKAPSLLRFRKNAELDLSYRLVPAPGNLKFSFLALVLGRDEEGNFSGRITGTFSNPEFAD